MERVRYSEYSKSDNFKNLSLLAQISSFFLKNKCISQKYSVMTSSEMPLSVKLQTFFEAYFKMKQKDLRYALPQTIEPPYNGKMWGQCYCPS